MLSEGLAVIAASAKTDGKIIRISGEQAPFGIGRKIVMLL